ncbi:MAG TPA: protein kinase [Thermomicrobiales bacterium]|nr:protein kinase [Thermomicrobiales bacterium]
MSDLQARLQGALADRYRLDRELGAGGMATVYLAHDLKHDRKVAIKVLRPELVHALGPERFLREIATTANLHHPHILPLYDSGRTAEPSGALLYYVMPLVEGESLRDRLRREKQLPLDDALRIAREVADALSYAHGHGVIHRDIKPENILLESSHALVADFGIARAVSAAGADRLTDTGLALGTPAYMSPEQAAGDRDVDGRSDLYALGCVLYEMLAGQPPFSGPTVQSIAHQHLTATPPPITQLRPAVPGMVAAALERALAKNPADRFSPVGQFAEALSTLQTLPPPAIPTAPPRRMMIAGLVALGILAAVLLGPRLGHSDSPLTIGQTVQVTRDPGLEIDPALSPDGSLVAYAAGPPTRMQIFVRQVGGGRTIALTSDSAEGYRWPRWSPDGSRIAYQGDAGIAVVPALGGQPRLAVRLEAQAAESTTSAFTRLAGFAWSPDGRRIAYSTGIGRDVTVVPVEGGAATHLTGVRDVHSLSWSPDGTRLAAVADNPTFVFGSVYFGNEATSSIWILPVNGKPAIQVTADQHLNDSPQWAPDGRHLFWVSDRGGSRDVYRVRLDAAGAPAGKPERLTTGADAHTISLSADGRRLAYARFRSLSNIWSIPVPAAGTVSIAGARPVTTGDQTIETVDVARDGRWLVFNSDRSGTWQIYRMPAAGGEPIQLTTDSSGAYSPAWSPDGRQIAFHSMRAGNRDLYTMEADGSRLVQRTSSPGHELDPDWSRDGHSLLAEVIPPGDQSGTATTFLAASTFILVPLDGGATRTIKVPGDFPHWSPTEDLIAFHSSEGLRVMSPDGATHLLVPNSTSGEEAFFAAWSPDGKTVYYVSKGPEGSSIRAVPVTGGPARLLVRFDDPNRPHALYGFTTDGRTFYFTVGAHESDIWVAELETR